MAMLLDRNNIALTANAELVKALLGVVVARSTLEILAQLVNAAVLGRKLNNGLCHRLLILLA